MAKRGRPPKSSSSHASAARAPEPGSAEWKALPGDLQILYKRQAKGKPIRGTLAATEKSLELEETNEPEIAPTKSASVKAPMIPDDPMLAKPDKDESGELVSRLGPDPHDKE